MREIRGGVFQGRFHNLLISKNNTISVPQISRITFQVVYPPVETTDLPPELASRHPEELLWRTDALMVDKLEAYVAPLCAEGVAVSPLLRVGNPREVIVEVATSLK